MKKLVECKTATGARITITQLKGKKVRVKWRFKKQFKNHLVNNWDDVYKYIKKYEVNNGTSTKIDDVTKDLIDDAYYEAKADYDLASGELNEWINSV